MTDDGKIDEMRKRTVENRQNLVVALKRLGYSDEEITRDFERIGEFIRKL